MVKIENSWAEPSKMGWGIYVATVEKIHEKLWTDKVSADLLQTCCRIRKNNIRKFG